MKAIILTFGLLWLCSFLSAQELQLHNLYWSKGTLGLEDNTEKQGFTCYIPGHDVVFYKSLANYDVKIYHLSKVSWLSYYDNGMHQQREFVKMNDHVRRKGKLYEVISLGKLHLIRLPNPNNWKWNEVSQQWMDHSHKDNQYTYQIAYTASDNTIRMLAEKQEKAISRFIQNYDLDCYAPDDREQLKEFYRQQENLPLTALIFE